MIPREPRSTPQASGPAERAAARRQIARPVAPMIPREPRGTPRASGRRERAAARRIRKEASVTSRESQTATTAIGAPRR
ncbi:hypothetical protein [Amycolatopsis plumensis]|uniref:hypothetical protein n=1 Tax=Amycolatopsis plumensis TaxID=236508 RepID=UPI00361B5EB4